jgi:hypothetical protein
MTRVCAAYGVVGLLRSKATPSPPPAKFLSQIPVGSGAVGGRRTWAEPIAIQTGEVRVATERWYWNQGGLYGFDYWSSPYASAGPATTWRRGPPDGDRAPAVNVYPPVEPTSFDRAFEGGCVIHKLIYDRDCKCVGERQTRDY